MFSDGDTVTGGVPLVFTAGFLATLVVLLTVRRLVLAVARMPDRAFTCVSGYLRPPPAPWIESSLRQAFAELDRDLALILRHDQAPL